MAAYDEIARRFGAPRPTALSRIVVAVVVRVRAEDVGADRPRLLVDLIEEDTRSAILNAVVSGWGGYDWHEGPPYLRATTKNAATGVTFSTDFAKRIGTMAADDQSEGWDGDRCVVTFMGRQAIILGTITPSHRNADLAANQWTDPNHAKWLKPGTTLAGASQYDPATDEVPTTDGDGHPDQWFRRFGRMVASWWRTIGWAWELRSTNGDAVGADAVVHAEATQQRVQLRAPRVLVQFQAGAKALGVDLDASDENDTTLVLTPVCRHAQTKVVAARLQDEIDELKQKVAALAAQHNALLTDHKLLQVACAAIQFAGGTLTNTTAAVPQTSAAVNGDTVKPAPTPAEITAMRSLAVKAAA